MDFESWRHCGGTLHYRASVIIARRSVNWAQRTFERPRECAVERPQLADRRRSLAIESQLGASLLFSFAPHAYTKKAWRKPSALARCMSLGSAISLRIALRVDCDLCYGAPNSDYT
jgi:hypothetical protein